MKKSCWKLGSALGTAWKFSEHSDIKEQSKPVVPFIIRGNHVLCAWSKKALSDGEKKSPNVSWWNWYNSQNRINRDDVQCIKIKKYQHSSNYTVPWTAVKEL